MKPLASLCDIFEDHGGRELNRREALVSRAVSVRAWPRPHGGCREVQPLDAGIRVRWSEVLQARRARAAAASDPWQNRTPPISRQGSVPSRAPSSIGTSVGSFEAHSNPRSPEQCLTEQNAIGIVHIHQLDRGACLQSQSGVCARFLLAMTMLSGHRVHDLADSRVTWSSLARKLVFEIVLHDGAEGFEHEGLLDPCVRHAVQEGRRAIGEDAAGDEHHARRLF